MGKKDMKYREEEIQEIIYTRQLEAIGERLEEDIAGILNRTGMYFRIFNRAKTPFSIAQKLSKEGYGFGEEEKKLQGELKRSEGMRGNPNFVNKAPEEKIRQEREKLAKYQGMMAQVQERLAQLAE